MKKILIVDDAIVARMILRKILTQAGYEVVGEAGSGLEAIEKYKELKPDIVAMDIVMPGMDGIEATKEIVSIDPTANVIITSAIHQKELSLKALDAGAASYIVKPFETDRLLRTFSRLFESKKGNDAD